MIIFLLHPRLHATQVAGRQGLRDLVQHQIVERDPRIEEIEERRVVDRRAEDRRRQVVARLDAPVDVDDVVGFGCLLAFGVTLAFGA